VSNLPPAAGCTTLLASTVLLIVPLLLALLLFSELSLFFLLPQAVIETTIASATHNVRILFFILDHFSFVVIFWNSNISIIPYFC
jgi:hypothetical protein